MKLTFWWGGRRLRSEHTEHFRECPSVTGTVQRDAGVQWLLDTGFREGHSEEVLELRPE